MKVFFLPSWYPTTSQPLAGLFIRAHFRLMATTFPDSQFAVSLWGSNLDALLLEAADPLLVLKKVTGKKDLPPPLQQRLPNLSEYFTPAHTWSRRLLKGNIRGIIAANEKNLLQFISSYGKPDVIHAYVAHPGGYVAMALSQKYQIPFIITEEMSPFPLPSYGVPGNLSKWIRKPYMSAWANVAVSESLKRKMEREAIPRLRVIPNFVDGDFFTASAAQRSTAQTLLFVGRLEHQKGVDILLRSFSQLSSRNASLQLNIVGDGSLADELRTLAKTLGVGESVHWHGLAPPEKVRQLMDDCDLFVLPSRHETFGIVVAEAMAMGKPIVATRCGGPEEIVDQQSGLIVDPENADLLTLAVETMIDNYASYDPQAIRASVLSRFSSSYVCHSIRELYDDVINGPKPV